MEFDEASLLANQKIAAADVSAVGAEKTKPNPEAADKLFAAAIDDWQRLVSKYPGTAEAARAALNIGITLEERLGKMAEGLRAHKKSQRPQPGEATERSRNLTAKQPRGATHRKHPRHQ